ncbi:hypothetical protein CRM22_007502 [Opisthorchis felineus]|uniref:Gamma-tubulin complex component n=1 Tax=Opisthorchis felineus TaxID=147828 RepID=A0A4S2LHR3_OPIFE|nr:hypothetical protein CRM22_007502 [Opisthorchis felineus]
MLQELLLALYGVPGATFVETSSPAAEDSHTFVVETELVPVSENLPFVSQGELSLQSDLLKLGSCYRHLEHFIRRHAGPHYSLYFSALACGLDDALADYRQSLVRLESEVLSNPDLSVAHFAYRLHSYKLLLPFLADLAQKIESLNEKEKAVQHRLGCRLLDILVLSAPVGVPGPRLAVRQLVARAMRVFCRQLHSWLVYGRLHDPHDEFFVQCSTRVSEDTVKHSSTDDHFQFGDANSFTLVVDRIPSFLPASFATHVLSVGEAINHTIRDNSQPDFLSELEQRFGPRFTELSKVWELVSKSAGDEDEQAGIESLIDLNPLLSLVTDIRTFVSHRVWQLLVKEHGLAKYLVSVKEVALLGRGELFLAFVDQLNSLSDLDPLANTGDTVPTEGIKSLFCRGVLDRPPPRNADEAQALEYDVQTAFLAAARAIGLDDDELDAKFKFTVSTDPSDADGVPAEEQTAWDCLHLQLMVPQALRMVFSKHVCRGYDRLFRYLATIRRTQIALQHYWAEQTSLWRCICAPQQFSRILPRKDIPNEKNQMNSLQRQSNIDRRLLVRNAMAFFVESLQCFLQVDVIDSQFSYLSNRIQIDEDIDSVLAAHEAFLAGLQAQALLFHPAAKPCIMQLLSVCRRFVLAAAAAAAAAAMTDNSGSQLSETEDRLVYDFHQVSFTLFQCLSSSESTGAKSSIGLEEVGTKRYDQPAGPRADLSQLLLRLDFNHFYSDSRGSFRPWSRVSSASDGTTVI